MTAKDRLWKREDLSRRFLKGIRRAIPLADYQIKIILLLIGKIMPKAGNFLDLGCGDGILGRAILSRYPKARGIFLDFSPAMIQACRKKAPKNKKLSFFTRDYGKPSWVNAVKGCGKFDVVVSGLSIHHQPDKRKKEIYKEVFDLLRPGGLFLNLEHVSSPSARLRHIFDEFFIDSLYNYHRRIKSGKTRHEIARHHYKNPLRKSNILSPVDTQCSWLKGIGFKEVDCYLKVLELALFGGIKPGK